VTTKQREKTWGEKKSRADKKSKEGRVARGGGRILLKRSVKAGIRRERMKLINSMPGGRRKGAYEGRGGNPGEQDGGHLEKKAKSMICSYGVNLKEHRGRGERI